MTINKKFIELFIKVTTKAALASFYLVGKKDKIAADKAATDAMRSELRSLRQTAVSLTVGEKEGASALIKEWLEDNPNKSDEDDEGAGEE